MRSAPLAAFSLATLLLAAACTSGGATPSASGTPSQPASAQPSTPPAASSPGAGGNGGAGGSSPSASASSAGGVPATADALDGRTFIVTAATGHAIVNGSEITLRFTGGRLAISAGCNQMSGAFELNDGVLTAGEMMSTEMACAEPLMAQDTWISGFVTGAKLTLDGPILVLAKADVTLTATDKVVARPARPLAGTSWVVDGLVVNQTASSVPAGVTATLGFANGKVTVDTGCNQGGGPAELGDTAITFGPIVTTKMGCANNAMAVERHVLGVLQGDVAWVIDSDALTLTGAGGGLHLRATP
jgi:heat shock protein HslJ